MQIRQLSVSYILDQDRILMRVRTSTDEEMALWFTRRLCVHLWPLLHRVTTDLFAVPPNAVSDGGVDLDRLSLESRQMLVDAQRQQALQNADFSAPYQAGEKSKRPFGEAPLLVTEINITPRPHVASGQMQLQIHFREVLEDKPQARGFEMVLAADFVFNIMHLLENAIKQSEWGLDVSNPFHIFGSDEESDFELTDDGKRPVYLN